MALVPSLAGQRYISNTCEIWKWSVRQCILNSTEKKRVVDHRYCSIHKSKTYISKNYATNQRIKINQSLLSADANDPHFPYQVTLNVEYQYRSGYCRRTDKVTTQPLPITFE